MLYASDKDAEHNPYILPWIDKLGGDAMVSDWPASRGEASLTAIAPLFSFLETPFTQAQFISIA